MLVWLAEHLVKYYSGFNVFSYLTFPSHCQPADRAVPLLVDGAAGDQTPAGDVLRPGGA
jgi:hypothetical protein